MIQRGIAATTHTDIHGDTLSKEDLIQMAKDINEDEEACGAGLDHDLLVMPIGKTIHGEVFPMDDGEYLLEIQQELFDRFEIIKAINGERYVKAKIISDKRPLKEEISYCNPKLTICVDKTNFSNDSFQEFWNQFDNDDIKREVLIRKSAIPDPEIVIKFITGTIFVLCTMIGKKTFDKLSDSISTDIESSYQIAKKAVLSFIKCTKTENKIVTYAFEDNYDGILVQLIVRTNNANEVVESISREKLQDIGKKIDELKQQFEISKIQFLYDEDNGWQFRYLTTNEGGVIGTKVTFRYTKKQMKKYYRQVEIKLDPRKNDAE